MLLVGADLFLPPAPESVHRVDVRAARREPDQLDIELRCQLPRCVCRVSAGFVQQQRYLPAAICFTDRPQSRVEVRRANPWTNDKSPLAGLNVDRPEPRPLSRPLKRGYFGANRRALVGKGRGHRTSPLVHTGGPPGRLSPNTTPSRSRRTNRLPLAAPSACQS